MNLSADEAKLAGLCAGNCATTQLVWILKFAFGPKKLPGLSRNGSLKREKKKACGARWEGERQKTGGFSSHNAPYLPPKILHNLCFSFLLRITAVSREIETMLKQKFRGQIRCIVRGDVQVAYCYH